MYILYSHIYLPPPPIKAWTPVPLAVNFTIYEEDILTNAFRSSSSNVKVKNKIYNYLNNLRIGHYGHNNKCTLFISLDCNSTEENVIHFSMKILAPPSDLSPWPRGHDINFTITEGLHMEIIIMHLVFRKYI